MKLGKQVSTRLRESDEQIDFYERNNSSYSGEFTDAKRFYFVLEPPDDPEPYPDIDAIRAEMEARQRAADAALIAANQQETAEATQRSRAREGGSHSTNTIPNASPLVNSFLESMVMNYERWHDGIGYDLTVFDAASPEERKQIEELLVTRPVNDWRDVEALATLDSPRARDKLRRTFETADLPQKIDLIAHATSLFTDDERTEVLVTALRDISQSPTLTQVMLEVQDFHPQPVIDALLAGVRSRDGATAGSFAMMLLFIHGKATSPYDFSVRPFTLRFQTDDRETMYCELCERIRTERAD